MASGGQAQALLAAWPGEALSAAAALEGVTAADLRRHVSALADDTFEGRETGSRGGRAAAGYLQMQFKAYGLRPAGESGGYFQQFNGNSRNILGMVEGSDPALRHEVILVSAHYDHVGYGNARNSFGPTGFIHNGADDNASGAATLLEVAQACAQLEPKPKRSILFALWDAEESGLNGSKHWLAKPTLKLSDVRLMINMDMVGRLRNNKLTVYGARTAGAAQAGQHAQSRRTDDGRFRLANQERQRSPSVLYARHPHLDAAYGSAQRLPSAE